MSENLKKRLLTSTLLILSFILMFRYNFILVYSLLVLGIFSSLEFLNLSKKILVNIFYKIFINFFFIIYIFLFSFILIYFFNFSQLKILIFIILSGCVASDIGGYIVGKIFKGPKLTKISPKKTFSGAFGSLMFTNIIILILFFYFTGILSSGVILTASVTSITCQLGDLLFSFIKRKAKMKDTGNFFPGHGGVLDRIDGILLGFPMGMVTAILFI